MTVFCCLERVIIRRGFHFQSQVSSHLNDWHLEIAMYVVKERNHLFSMIKMINLTFSPARFQIHNTQSQIVSTIVATVDTQLSNQ